MNCGTISGGVQFCSKLNLRTNKSNPQISSQIFFKTHLSKSTISIKRSFKTEAAIDNLYETEQEETEFLSFYELLGISESGTQCEIKRAYKQLALKYHPDVSPPDRAEEYTKRFIMVQEAYETLSDPNTRASYDRDLAMGLHLAFCARKRPQYHQGFGEWRDQWENQLIELKRRSENKDSRKNMSWAARIRRQKKPNHFDNYED